MSVGTESRLLLGFLAGTAAGLMAGLLRTPAPFTAVASDQMQHSFPREAEVPHAASADTRTP